MIYGYLYGEMLIVMGIIWIIQLIIGYLMYRDAKSRMINALLRFMLVILPMIGWLFLVIYVFFDRLNIRKSLLEDLLYKFWINDIPKGKSAQKNICG
jgi:hypothetical protein